MSSYKKMAKVYDELIYEDIDYSKISNKIMDSFNKHSKGNEYYLDLACGTGNVAIELQNNFKNTFLVDLSQDMLIEAEGKFREKRKKVKIVCQDMCELNLNRKFNLITCVLDSTNYILEEEDLKSYFESVYNHLEDEGIFVFDINSYYKLSEVLGNNIYTYNSEDVFYTWENIFEDDILEMNLTFFIKDGILYEKFEEVHEERAYREEEIENILNEIGFEILEKNEAYSEKEVDENSERIVYIVKKKN